MRKGCGKVPVPKLFKPGVTWKWWQDATTGRNLNRINETIDHSFDSRMKNRKGNHIVYYLSAWFSEGSSAH